MQSGLGAKVQRGWIVAVVAAAVMSVAACDSRRVSHSGDSGGGLAADGASYSDPDAAVVSCTSAGGCAASEYCDASGCGQKGVCKARPAGCDKVGDPVCGCDGKTYGNPCMASSEGVTVASKGACLGPGGCSKNSDCQPDELCDFPGGCGTLGPGTCAKRPTDCPTVSAPVCGCNGLTHPNECSAKRAGVDSRHGGVCKSTPKSECEKLSISYAITLPQAKACSPLIDSLQCTLKVRSSLACGCDTFINPGSAANTKIQSLIADWKKLGCDTIPWPCPAIPCRAVTKAVCDDTTSRCVDKP